MKKLTITCDCCGDEIQDDKVFTIEHRIHVSPSFNRMNGHSYELPTQPKATELLSATLNPAIISE